jgi:hypothetical protein
MERERKQQSSSGSAVGLGLVCSFIGAAIGAIGYHFWKKEEEMRQQHHSHSEYVTVPRLIACHFLRFMTEGLSIFDSLLFISSLLQTCPDNSNA